MLSSHAEDGHQIYFGGSVVGKASSIGIEISPTRPISFAGVKKWEIWRGSFYSAVALLAMQSAVLATAEALRPSVMFHCFVHRNEGTIVRSSVSASTMTLVSGEVKFIWIFAGITHRR